MTWIKCCGVAALIIIGSACAFGSLAMILYGISSGNYAITCLGFLGFCAVMGTWMYALEHA